MQFYERHRALEAVSRESAETDSSLEAASGPRTQADARLQQPIQGQELPDAYKRRIVAQRARRVLHESIDPIRDAEHLDDVERRLMEGFERVHQERNFLPASFLEDGARRARAVCRVPFRTPEGSFVGTGFLVARGILLTNNHVLESVAIAENAVAEFDYELGKQRRRVALLPQELFYTLAPLDFTIVACDADAVSDIEPISLLRDAAAVWIGERVNIVQHPAGRPKEVVLQDNKVLRVLDTLLYYEADTEGGSSGSPVFDNDWNVVGLHHWGRQLDGGSAENRAIRIPAILAHLRGLSSSNGAEAIAAGRVLENASGNDPMLGFFDVSGATDDPREVQVSSFSGTREFADVGFWNIEHFNDRVSSVRMSAVADVVAGLGLDALGLVEVQRGAMERLVRALRDRGLSSDFVLVDAPGSQDIAILVDRETTAVRARDDIVERHRDLLRGRIRQGTVFPRLPLFADVTVRRQEDGAETRFLMIVVHLKAFTNHAPSRARRRAAANALGRIIAEERDQDPNLRIVLGGDFNEFLTNDVLSGVTDSPDLFAMTADDAASGAASFIGGSRRSLIDHIVVSKDVRASSIDGDDAAIVRLDRSAGDFDATVSDHVPLVFRMIFEESDGDVRRGVGGLSVPEGTRRIRMSFFDEQNQPLG